MSDYPSYLGANEQRRCDSAIKRVCEAIVGGPIEFLFGAGMSAPSGAPSGRGLATILLSEFFPGSKPSEKESTQLLADFPLETLAEAVEADPGEHRGRLTSILRKALIEDPRIHKSPAHDALQSVIYWGGKPCVTRLWTTNFETLIESALSGRGVAVTEETAHLAEQIRGQGKIPVLHLHGLLTDDGKYQVTERDLYSRETKSLTVQLAGAVLDARAFVFVGYSLGDPDFRSLYLTIRNTIEGRVRQTQPIIVGPAENQYHFAIANAIWKARGIEWIPLDAESFFRRVLAGLEDGALDTLKDKIMAERRIDFEAYENLVQDTMNLLAIPRATAIQILATAPPSGSPAKS